MKTLNITMTVLADSYKEADYRGQAELMELVKRIGMSSGSTIASCEGDTKHRVDNRYEVKAKVRLDGIGDVTSIIEETQDAWLHKFDILYSSIYAAEEEKSEPVQKPRDYEAVTCERCGQVMVKGYENVINHGTEYEYCLCNMCYEGDDDVFECDGCLADIDRKDLVLNPVTCEKDLCPCCGSKIVC